MVVEHAGGYHWMRYLVKIWLVQEGWTMCSAQDHGDVVDYDSAVADAAAHYHVGTAYSFPYY